MAANTHMLDTENAVASHTNVGLEVEAHKNCFCGSLKCHPPKPGHKRHLTQKAHAKCNPQISGNMGGSSRGSCHYRYLEIIVWAPNENCVQLSKDDISSGCRRPAYAYTL